MQSWRFLMVSWFFSQFSTRPRSGHSFTSAGERRGVRNKRNLMGGGGMEEGN